MYNVLGGIMYKISTDLYSKNYQPQSQATKQFPFTDNTHMFQTLFSNIPHTSGVEEAISHWSGKNTNSM